MAAKIGWPQVCRSLGVMTAHYWPDAPASPEGRAQKQSTLVGNRDARAFVASLEQDRINFSRGEPIWASACCAAADWAPSATSQTATPSWLRVRPASTCAPTAT